MSLDVRKRLLTLARLAAAALNPLLRYVPGPPHLQWLQDQSHTKLLRAPSQSGKTTAAAWELIHRCLGTHPYSPCKTPPIEARVVCYSFPQAIVIMQKIHELMPPGVLDEATEFHRVRGYKHKTILFKNGSVVKFVTASQERLALASATLDLIWIDEPPPMEVYAECMSRLVQTNGYLMMTLTPVGRPLKWLRDAVEAGDSAISETHYILSTESCPWMTQEQVDEAIRKCLPSQRPQVIYAEWDGITPDRFIEAFDQTCISDEIGHDGEASVILGMDHGERPGSEVCLLIYYWMDQRTKLPHAHVWDEYVSPGRTTEEQDALFIQNMLGRNSLSLYSVDKARGDVNSSGKSNARQSVNQAFERAFRLLSGGQLPFRIEKPRKGPGSILRGAKVINTAFLDARLHVHPRCKNLIRTLSHWQGKDDDLKHLFDGLSYVAYDMLDVSVAGSRTKVHIG